MIEAVFGLSPLLLAFVVVVGAFGFILSSTFGIGGAILLIPALMISLPPAQAVALAAPVMLANNLMKWWVFRKHVDKRATWLVSALSVPAAFLAALFAADVDERFISLGVAAIILLSLGVEHVQQRPVQMPDRGLLSWGLVTGVISGLCGAAGPPTAIGLKGYGLSREAFVGTVAVFAVFLQLAKMPAYLHAGLLPSSLWPLALLLSATALIGVTVAPTLLRRMPVAVFRRLLDGVLVLSALWLIVDVALRW